jgi:hypothetical protein
LQTLVNARSLGCRKRWRKCDEPIESLRTKVTWPAQSFLLPRRWMKPKSRGAA